MRATLGQSGSCVATTLRKNTLSQIELTKVRWKLFIISVSRTISNLVWAFNGPHICTPKCSASMSGLLLRQIFLVVSLSTFITNAFIDLEIGLTNRG